jgi:hypothetical protein
VPTELAPLRRAQQLLRTTVSAEEIISDLAHGFGLCFADAMAALAAASLLSTRGLVVAEEPIARPYVRAAR